MREMYHEQLASVIADLVSMTRGVQEATRQATAALLSADTELAERVIGADAHIDRARESIEDQSFEILALQQPVAGDLRMLVAALRMVADLERMGDLAVHVAKITRIALPGPRRTALRRAGDRGDGRRRPPDGAVSSGDRRQPRRRGGCCTRA
jgi:phosphate transport system protein